MPKLRASIRQAMSLQPHQWRQVTWINEVGRDKTLWHKLEIDEAATTVVNKQGKETE